MARAPLKVAPAQTEIQVAIISLAATWDSVAPQMASQTAKLASGGIKAAASAGDAEI